MKILIGGDFCPQNRVVDLLNQNKYDELYGEIPSICSKADLSVLNLECPVSYGEEPSIVKCGPTLRSNEKSIDAVKFMGFDAVTLANNHFFDYGDTGVDHTLHYLKEAGIDYMGGGKNIEEASKIYYKQIKNEKIAIINCCEHEFSIASESKGGSNPLNPIQQFYAIQIAKKNADYVVLIIHGGLEGYQLPLPRMQETYRFFIDAGADAVVNHHQHCYSGYEIYNGKPIFYGLGNFSFYKSKNKLWTEGFLLLLDLKPDLIGYEMIPYVQGLDRPGVSIMKGDDKKNFEEKITILNEIISSEERLEDAFSKHFNENGKWYPIIFEPWGKGFRLLRSKGFLPSLVSKTKWLALADYMICETHSDCVKEYFNRLVKEYNK